MPMIGTQLRAAGRWGELDSSSTPNRTGLGLATCEAARMNFVASEAGAWGTMIF